MAQQLVAAGEDVAVLALFDANARSPGTPATLDDGSKGGITLRGLGRWARGASELSPAQWRTLLRIKVRFASARLRQLVRSDNGRAAAWRVESLADAIGLSDSHRAVGRALREAMRRHAPRPYAGRMVLFRPRMQPRFNTGDPSRGWSRLTGENLTIITVPGNHLAMLHEPHVTVLARELTALLDTAESGAATRP
jgi:thioesterase domain-containing protein